MSVDHYENFPVASFVLPSRLRPAVVAIYRFARTADDIADEGDGSDDQRLSALDNYRRELDAIASNREPSLPLFVELSKVIDAHDLPLQPFRDLLDAFSQDVIKPRYRDFLELLDYCRRSANPIGRLLLCLYRAASDENIRRSDAICTGLQLTNFWQDVAVDWKKNRIYLPQDELSRFRVDEAQIARGQCDENWRDLMAFQIARSRKMITDGAPLARDLPGRIGLELRMIVAGGLRILEKLTQVRGDVFKRRPVLSAFDWPVLAWRAVMDPSLALGRQTVH